MIVELVISSNPYLAADLVTGLASFARTQPGWNIQVANDLGRPRHQAVSEFADAAIFDHEPRDMTPPAPGKPVVMIVRPGSDPCLPCVLPDEPEIGRVAARHLIERGIGRLTFVGFDDVWSRGRLAGVVDAAREAQVQAVDTWPMTRGSSAWTLPSYGELMQSEALDAWATRLARGTGIVAASDLIASALLDALLRLGRSIPEDHALVSVDNNLMRCAYHRVPISSVPIDGRRIGHDAGRLVAAALRGESLTGRRVVVPPLPIVARRSSDILAIADPDIARAVRFIRDKACEGISTADVLREVAVSRRWLDQRLKQTIGRTCADEIERVRLEHARSLLVASDASLTEVSAAAGFNYLSHFSHAFKRHFGQTPSAVRSESRRGRG